MLLPQCLSGLVNAGESVKMTCFPHVLGRATVQVSIQRDRPMAEELNVKVRETRGKRNARRGRLAGSVPAVLYGHGKENISLAVPADELSAAIRRGSKLVELAGEVKDTALIREVQWDTFGIEILHVDLTRVSAGERVEMTVRVELRGEAPGTREGGIVEHLIHEVQIECPATSIPDRLRLNINALELGDVLLASVLELPSGARLVGAEDAVVVQCVAPAVAPEEEEGLVEGGAEPEIIGRKAEEEEEETKKG